MVLARDGDAPLGQRDYEVLAAFRGVLRRFQRQSDESVRKAQLTPQQHQALLVLKGGYPGQTAITVKALAEALVIKHQSAVELVGRLIKAGLVISSRSEVDRRKMMISVTPAGDRVLRSLSSANVMVLQQAAPILSDLLSLLEHHGYGAPVSRRGR